MLSAGSKKRVGNNKLFLFLFFCLFDSTSKIFRSPTYRSVASIILKISYLHSWLMTILLTCSFKNTEGLHTQWAGSRSDWSKSGFEVSLHPLGRQPQCSTTIGWWPARDQQETTIGKKTIDYCRVWGSRTSGRSRHFSRCAKVIGHRTSSSGRLESFECPSQSGQSSQCFSSNF